MQLALGVVLPYSMLIDVCMTPGAGRTASGFSVTCLNILTAEPPESTADLKKSGPSIKLNMLETKNITWPSAPLSTIKLH